MPYQYEIVPSDNLSLVSIVLRVALALALGGMLGMERGRKNHSAGFRTHMLVCLGAALVMMTNQYAVGRYGGDPTRLGAQVISGIGFLGAGAILVTARNQIRGLTTAAGLWAAACMGLAIGIGFYEGAILMGITILLIMTAFQRISDRISENSRYVQLYLSFQTSAHFDEFLGYCSRKQIKVSSIERSKSRQGAGGTMESVIVSLKCPVRNLRATVLRDIGLLDGLNHVEEL